MTEQTIAFDDAQTGSGTALLLLPGSSGTGTGWKALMGHLGDGCRVVTTSPLGYGATPDVRPDEGGSHLLPATHPAEIAALIRRLVDAALIAGAPSP